MRCFFHTLHQYPTAAFDLATLFTFQGYPLFDALILHADVALF